VLSLEETKTYLRVDSSDEDRLIRMLIGQAEQLVMDAGRMDENRMEEDDNLSRIAALYAVGYLFEHREDADLHKLTLILRSILFGVREVIF
jgi:uncharacterized phage protein (predicted DNA packaging)